MQGVPKSLEAETTMASRSFALPDDADQHPGKFDGSSLNAPGIPPLNPFLFKPCPTSLQFPTPARLNASVYEAEHPDISLQSHLPYR